MIPFPKIHIAASVLNRISNALEENGPLGLANNQPKAVEVLEPPIAPNADVLGQEINNELKKGTAPIAVAPEMETEANNGMLEASATGGSPFDGALVGMQG